MLGLLAPAAVVIAVDDAIPRADRGRLGLLCLALVGVAAAVTLLQVGQGLALVRVRGRLESSLLPALWDRLLNLPARFFAAHEAGDLALRAMGLARVIEVLTGTSVASLLLGVSALANIAVLLLINWRLALVAVGLCGASLLVNLATLPSLWR